MDVQHKVDVANEATRAVPPILVAGSAHVLGLSLADWVAVATIVYIGLQMAFLLYKWRRLKVEKGAKDDVDE